MRRKLDRKHESLFYRSLKYKSQFKNGARYYPHLFSSPGLNTIDHSRRRDGLSRQTLFQSNIYGRYEILRSMNLLLRTWRTVIGKNVYVIGKILCSNRQKLIFLNTLITDTSLDRWCLISF